MNQTAIIDPKKDKELDSHIVRILQLEEDAEKLVIASEADSATASGWLIEVNKMKREIEKKRIFYTAPLLAHKKLIDDDFKQHLQPLHRADSALRNSLVTWNAQQARLRREEEARLRKQQAEEEKKRAELAKANAQPEPPPLPPPVVAPAIPKTTRPTGGGAVTEKKFWAFDVVDETKIPREYCVPDVGKIRSLVRAGIREIPGVNIYEKSSLSVRG